VPEAKGGRSYLQQRSRQLQEGREAERRFRAQIRQVHADLAQLATESQAAEQELACTYLVRHENAAAFRERAEGTGAHVTGPWPPYSFCSPLQEEPVRA
ncbi:MAG TPA: GvpL/GvpF family gas vesicle protein, partial [Symbiobacteriaceae bacterium]|nr:GvpL/GvpF family gas vesicle protein [Symbiobacteriaceae bacterium]